MSYRETPVKKRFVIYICEDGRVETHGGPYPPIKAEEIRDSMRSHISNENYSSWSIPEDTIYVGSVTRETLRDLKDS